MSYHFNHYHNRCAILLDTPRKGASVLLCALLHSPSSLLGTSLLYQNREFVMKATDFITIADYRKWVCPVHGNKVTFVGVANAEEFLLTIDIDKLTDERLDQFRRLAKSVDRKAVRYTVKDVLTSFAKHQDFGIRIANLNLYADGFSYEYKGVPVTESWQCEIEDYLSNLI